MNHCARQFPISIGNGNTPCVIDKYWLKSAEMTNYQVYCCMKVLIILPESRHSASRQPSHCRRKRRRRRFWRFCRRVARSSRRATSTSRSTSRRRFQWRSAIVFVIIEKARNKIKFKIKHLQARNFLDVQENNDFCQQIWTVEVLKAQDPAPG